MLAAWREYLRTSGASPTPSDSVPAETAADSARAALHGDVVADLCHRALITVSGADARTLLQGQFANDVEAVNESRTQLSAWCSIKGRVLALFRIWQRGETLYLELPAEQRDTIMARLRMYVLRARVSISDGTEDDVRFGVSGIRAAECLAQELGPLPVDPDRARQYGGSTLIRLRGDTPRFQIIAPFDAAAALWERCRRCAIPVALPAWDLLDIRAGVASIPAALSDQFLPQMLHLHRVDGLSFDKGCYAGQEIIARTQYLGRLKRRLHRAALNAPEPPAPGDALCAGTGDREGPVGQVVAVAPSLGPDAWELLAVIKDEATAGGLRLRDPLGPPLELLPLPCRAEPRAA